MSYQYARDMYPNQWFVVHVDGSGWARFDSLENALSHAGNADTIEGPLHFSEDN